MNLFSSSSYAPFLRYFSGFFIPSIIAWPSGSHFFNRRSFVFYVRRSHVGQRFNKEHQGSQLYVAGSLSLDGLSHTQKKKKWKTLLRGPQTKPWAANEAADLLYRRTNGLLYRRQTSCFTGDNELLYRRQTS